MPIIQKPWKCPNDRELHLRSILKLGWSSNKTDVRSPKTPGLSNVEVDAIMKVLARSEMLQTMERQRIRTLQDEMEDHVNRFRGDGHNTCRMCGTKFAKGKLSEHFCRFCGTAFCGSCQRNDYANAAMINSQCTFCVKKMEFYKKSGIWCGTWAGYITSTIPYELAHKRKGWQKVLSGSDNPTQFKCEHSDSDFDDEPSESLIPSVSDSCKISLTTLASPLSAMNKHAEGSIACRSSDDSAVGSVRMSRASSVATNLHSFGHSGEYIVNTKTANQAGHKQISSIVNSTPPSSWKSNLDFGSLNSSLFGSHSETTIADGGNLQLKVFYDDHKYELSIEILSINNWKHRFKCGGSNQQCFLKMELVPANSNSTEHKTKNAVYANPMVFLDRHTYSGIDVNDMKSKTIRFRLYANHMIRNELLGETSFPLSIVVWNERQIITKPIDDSRPHATKHHRTFVMSKMLSSDLEAGRIQIIMKYSTYVKRLYLKILKCVHLAAMDITNTSDPYVRMTLKWKHLNRKIQYRTSFKSCTLNPHFNEEFAYSVDLNAERETYLVLTVFDHDYTKGDDMIGEVTLSSESPTTSLPWTSSFQHPNENHQWWLKLDYRKSTNSRFGSGKKLDLLNYLPVKFHRIHSAKTNG